MQVLSTKKCPVCHDERLVLLRSINKKYCTECNTYLEWALTKNQLPLVGNNRIKAVGCGNE